MSLFVYIDRFLAPTFFKFTPLRGWQVWGYSNPTRGPPTKMITGNIVEYRTSKFLSYLFYDCFNVWSKVHNTHQIYMDTKHNRNPCLQIVIPEKTVLLSTKLCFIVCFSRTLSSLILSVWRIWLTSTGKVLPGILMIGHRWKYEENFELSIVALIRITFKSFLTCKSFLKIISKKSDWTLRSCTWLRMEYAQSKRESVFYIF